MSVNVSEVLSAIERAKEAYDAAPDLRRRIDELEAALSRKGRDLDDMHGRYLDTQRQLGETQSKLSATEGERDNYFLEAEEAKDTLGKLRALVGPAPATLQPLVGDVNQPSGMSGSPSEPVMATPVPGQSASGPTSTTIGTGAEQSVIEQSQGQSEPHPTQGDTVYAQTPTSYSSPTSPDVSAEPSFEGQSEARPTYTAPSQEQSAISNNASPPATVSTDGASSQSGSVQTPIEQVEQGHNADKPYLNQPSWSKPNFMTWKEWKAKGGYVPAWAVDEDAA